MNIERHHLAGFALNANFERATADFAIGGETLIANGRVELQIEAASAEGTLNLFGQLHTGSNCNQHSAGVLVVQIKPQIETDTYRYGITGGEDNCI